MSSYDFNDDEKDDKKYPAAASSKPIKNITKVQKYPAAASSKPKKGITKVQKHLSSASALKTKKYPNGDKLKFLKDLVFVGMSFKGEDQEEVFTAIKEACKELNLSARRVDENYSSGFIILEIIDMIEKAEFIIFDLTHERPNVYYELGYAHGLGNSPSDILLIAKEGTQLHFDIAALRIRFYKSTEDLRKIIRLYLSQMVKAART